jgi:X-Pro dipeptidyl-peptidase-like protein
VVAGRVVVHLKAALSAGDANFKTILYDVAPDGTATFVNDGYLKASHRLSHERKTPLTPGRLIEFDIPVWPTHWRFVRGHVLRLQVFGGESTQLVPEQSDVTTTVAVGEGGSSADLPVPGLASRPGSPGCLARRAPIGARNIGRVRLGLTRRALLRRVPAPRRRTERSWRWCVKGGKGTVAAAFTRRGRVALVRTTAPRHGNRRIRPGARVRAMRRAYPRSRAIGRTLVRIGPRSSRLLGIRRGKVRHVAVTSRRTIRKRTALRKYLRYAR